MCDLTPFVFVDGGSWSMFSFQGPCVHPRTSEPCSEESVLSLSRTQRGWSPHLIETPSRFKMPLKADIRFHFGRQRHFWYLSVPWPSRETSVSLHCGFDRSVHRKAMIEAAARYRVPTICPFVFAGDEAWFDFDPGRSDRLLTSMAAALSIYPARKRTGSRCPFKSRPFGLHQARTAKSLGSLVVHAIGQRAAS